ncbi:MAG: hypothetical protein KKA73_09430 [Chloroflexi bacterium]|nr:hypothetical protein [Chloroflexota bacterium]MBU1747898.1 hypothetical protein [Chloroflexota bacterium]
MTLDPVRIPALLIVISAFWLGSYVFARNPRNRAAQVFGLLALEFVVLYLAELAPAVTADASILYMAERVTLAVGNLLPPTALHLALAMTMPPRPLPRWTLTLTVGYLVGGAWAAYYLILPPEGLTAIFPVLTGVVHEPLLVVALRYVYFAVMLGAATVHLMRSYREAASSLVRRWLLLFLLSFPIAGLALTLGFVSFVAPLSRVWGDVCILIAVALVAYAVVQQGALLPTRALTRNFFYTLFSGGLVAAYVLVILYIEQYLSPLLSLQAPLVTVLLLVVLVALFQPIVDWLQARAERLFFREDVRREELLRSLSQDLVETADLDEWLERALRVVGDRLHLRWGLVATRPDDREPLLVRAIYGPAGTAPGTPLDTDLARLEEPLFAPDSGAPADGPSARLPLLTSDAAQPAGLVLLGPRLSGDPFSPGEQAMLLTLVNQLSLAVENDRLQTSLVRMLEQAQAQGQELRQRDQALQASLDVLLEGTAAPEHAGIAALRIQCLGPLVVSRGEEPITQWGGEKAGGRHAEAIFAFLIARQRQGVSKDEFLDLMWPELDLPSAENNLHRTLHALRRALEPDLRPRQQSSYVVYRRQRYWLNPAAPIWVDVEAFTQGFARGRRLESRGQPDEALAQYRQAEALYRGEYMQDAPFLADDAAIEPTREHLRETYAALMLRLGTHHEQTGRSNEALDAYRRALALVPEHPGLLEALARVQA